ncbi:MAG: RNA methyltransferase [Pseudomonadota bacterium]
MPAHFEDITSPANSLIKTLKGLERKKVRRETGLFLAEGMRLVQQGLAAGWAIRSLIVSAEIKDRPDIQALAQQAEGARLIAANARVMGQVARKDNPQTVIGAFEQQHRGVDDLPREDNGLWIGLYQVRDPGNLGTILRTADCAGIEGVLLIGTCCDPYSLECVRASMGSVFDTPFATASVDEFNIWCADTGIQRIAASMNGQMRHDAPPFSRASLILMGNEQSGLPETLEDACEHLVRIPMRGGADSLNLAQATAIMTYEAWRQRGFAGAREQ